MPCPLTSNLCEPPRVDPMVVTQHGGPARDRKNPTANEMVDAEFIRRAAGTSFGARLAEEGIATVALDDGGEIVLCDPSAPDADPGC